MESRTDNRNQETQGGYRSAPASEAQCAAGFDLDTRRGASPATTGAKRMLVENVASVMLLGGVLILGLVLILASPR